MPRLAIIIVNYRTPVLTIDGLRALDTVPDQFSTVRTIVVDGCSDDGSVEAIGAAIADSPPALRVSLLPLAINGGFAYANNRAMLHLASEGPLPDLIALINPDARVRPGALEAMARLLEREPGAGAVGARLEHEDGRAQASAFSWPSVRGEFCRGARTGLFNRLLAEPPVSIDASEALKVPWVTGAAVMFRTVALLDSGLFDEGFFLYFEETDLMRRLTAKGWDIWHEPAARVVHQGGAATKIRDAETGLLPSKPLPRYWYESRRRYFALAGGRIHAILASLAWLAGHLVYRSRRLLVPGATASDGPLRPGRDLMLRGFWPKRFDATVSAPSFSAVASEGPAWMTRSQ